MKTENKRFRFGTFSLISAFHFAALATIFWIIYSGEWYWLLLFLAIWPISHCMGLAVGFHRFLVHRSFTAPKWFEYLLTVCGQLTLQGGHLPWIATHRLHHRFTDQEQDPHSPVESFIHAHFGWMIWTDGSMKTPEFLKKYAADLYKDPVHYWLNKFWWGPSVLLGAGLFYFGGLIAVGVGVIIPVALGLEFTWLVNSACHYWGERPFNTPDQSTNNLWVAAVTFGEGWHNNHHDQPTRAKYGLKWFELDPGWWFIWLMGLFRIIKGIKA